MTKRYYFAYGSNLHPLRLAKRVPSARLVGASSLRDTTIVFHKRGVDGSGKCTLVKDGAHITGAYGVLYTIDAGEEQLLDEVEDLDLGYSKALIKCVIDDISYSGFTYIAKQKAVDASLKPFHWYKELVIAGAVYHHFPEDYVAYLRHVESIPDTDHSRQELHDRLLSEIYKVAK